MEKNSITNALGFMTLLFLVSACSTPVEEIRVRAEPVDKPVLSLPATDELNLKEIEWYVITPNNIDEKWAELEAAGHSLVFFAVSAKGYTNLSFNLNDLRTYIQSQDATILAYRKYYNEADRAIEEANGRIRSYWDTW